MRGIILTIISLVVVAIITVVVVVYAPQFIPSTTLGVISTLVVAVAAVIAAVSSIAQILDTIDRIRTERTKITPSSEQIADETYQLYQDSILSLCDVIDLTEIPVLDAASTMQEFTIRQLYIPLRLLIDRPSEIVTATTEVNGDGHRNFQRGIEAGRIDEQRQSLSTLKAEVSIGSLLNQHTRVVILGEPGSGKSTLVKWLALALMLREKNAVDIKEFPDFIAVPQVGWIPILVRCRDILDHQSVQVLDDLLAHSLQLRSQSPEKQKVLKDFLTNKVRERKALLIIDGLDEIRDTQTRTAFARRMKEIARQHRELPIVITSRKWGYEEMRSRLGTQFQHAEIADLKKPEKEKFARDWCRVAVPEIDREQQTQSLIAAIDSTKDIRQITSNALLLTILAIVLRKLHKLPHRRAELYRYFIQVLFDFNPTIYDRIDAREAVDQLSYLAYAMEKEGTSPIDEDQLLKHLTDLRNACQTPAINKHSPQEFIEQIQRQTSIIVQKGYAVIGAKEVAFYEFKHDTFRHYFAGLALVNNIYPNYRPGTQLGDRIRTIFENHEVVTRQIRDWASLTEWVVKENWQETLRLCVASAGLNDANNALDCMSNLSAGSLSSDEKPLLARMGAVMAALCLADEPNVSVQAGRQVIERLLTTIVDKDGLDDKANTSLDDVILKLSNSQEWRQLVDEQLLISLETYPHYMVSTYGSLYLTSHPELLASGLITPEVRTELLKDLRSDNKLLTIRACLKLIDILYRESILDSIEIDAELPDALFQIMARSHVEKLVAVWALTWLWDRYYLKNLDRSLSPSHIQILSTHLLNDTHPYVLRCVCDVLGTSYANGADFIYLWAVAADTGILNVPPMIPMQNNLNIGQVDKMLSLLKHPEKKLCRGVAVALARLGIHNDESVNILIAMMNDPTLPLKWRDHAVEGLVRIGGRRIIDLLVTQLEVDNDYIQTRSMLALIGINSEETLNGLCNKLSNNDPNVRYFAAAGLAVFVKNRNFTAVEALKQALISEEQEATKSEISRVLKLQPSQEHEALA